DYGAIVRDPQHAGEPDAFLHDLFAQPGFFDTAIGARDHRPRPGRHRWRKAESGAAAEYRTHHALPEDETIRDGLTPPPVHAIRRTGRYLQHRRCVERGRALLA